MPLIALRELGAAARTTAKDRLVQFSFAGNVGICASAKGAGCGLDPKELLVTHDEIGGESRQPDLIADFNFQ